MNSLFNHSGNTFRRSSPEQYFTSIVCKIYFFKNIEQHKYDNLILHEGHAF